MITRDHEISVVGENKEIQCSCLWGACTLGKLHQVGSLCLQLGNLHRLRPLFKEQFNPGVNLVACSTVTREVGNEIRVFCLEISAQPMSFSQATVQTSVATPWVFSQDLDFFDPTLGSGFFRENLGFFLGFFKSPWVFLVFFKFQRK